MSETLDQRKSAYLRDVEKDYFPTITRRWQTAKPTYYPVREIALASTATPNEEGYYCFRLEKSAVLMGIFFGVGFMSIFIWPEGPKAFIAIVLIILLTAILRQVIDRRVKLQIDSMGIHFDNLRSIIDWEDILAIYLKITSDDSDTQEIVLHYHETDSNKFKVEIVNINGLDKSYEDICFAIEYCKVLHMLQQSGKQIAPINQL